jgi:hypothetical protein
MPLCVGDIYTTILATDLMTANQADELIACVDAASPGVGVVVGADLVKSRCINAIEPIRHIGELNAAAVPDDRAGGEAWAGCENRQYQDKPPHQSEGS